MFSMDARPFGELLVTLRKQHGFTQFTLAAKLDVHRNTVSKWERGVCLPESKTLVLELAHQLRLDMYNTQRLLEASLTALSPYWHVPYPRNPFFTGRDAILHHLHEMLGYEQTAVLSQAYALSGLGGIGKTQIAIEYTYRYAHDYAAILWVGAENRESILSSFTAFADLLRLPERQDHDQDRVIAAVKLWLTSHREWLLIFDNVEDIGLLKTVLPTARCGAILLTTRQQEVGITAPTLILDTMTPEEGLQLLLSRVNRGKPIASPNALSPEETQAAREIVGIMDGLPLALDQAGAYIAETQCSLSDFLHLFRTSHLRLLEERNAHTDHPLSVSRTFALAFEQIHRSNASAADFLTVCAFLASEAIPEAFFIEGAMHLGPVMELLASDPFQFNAVVKALLMYSFLQRNAATRTVTIHRLVQAVLKGSLSEADQRTWAARVIRAMAHLFPPEKTHADYWQACERLLPHALACITLSDQWNDVPEHVILMSSVATYLSNRARFVEAKPLFQRALRIWEQALGLEHPLVADALHGLATLYRQQGKYAQAEPLFQRALVIREQISSPEVGSSLNNLAILYSQQGKYEQAEPLFQRAVYTWEQALGPEHPKVVYSLTNLAALYKEQGKYEQAEPLFQRALRIWEQALGPEHPQVSFPLSNLAELYFEQGKYEQVEQLFQRVLDIREQALGPEHPQVAFPLKGLAELYREQGKYKEAEALYQRTLQIREQALGTEHPLVAEPLIGLAALSCERGQYEQAEILYQRALALRQQHLGPQHPDVAQSLHHLAHFHQVQQQTAEALSLYQQALALYEGTLGPRHPKTRATHTAYTHLLRDLGRMDEAAALEDQVAEDETRSF